MFKRFIIAEGINGDAAADGRGEAYLTLRRLSSANSAPADQSGGEILEEDPAQDKEQDLRSRVPPEEEGVHGHAGTESPDPCG